MHSIKIHSTIGQIITIFYLMGFWHRGDEATAMKLIINKFYCVYYFLFIIALVVGAVENENKDESIFLVQISIAISVLLVKLWVLIWKQNEIDTLLNRICVFSIRDVEGFTIFSERLGGFMKFVTTLLCTAIVIVFFETGVLPFLGSEKSLFVKIGFPLDWAHNEISFWIANIFIFTELFLSMTSFSFSITTWYLMFNCSLRYEVLGEELKKMGHDRQDIKLKILEEERHRAFAEDLKKSIDAHIQLKESISDVETFFSNVFLYQLATSALCICGSIYCLAFNVSDFVELLIYLFILIYYLSEIFMITYLGNEIMLSSNRLSYCLFESEWVEQPQSTKKTIIFFGEHLKRSHVLLIGKLYPLTLDTFTKILKSVYNMFNILTNTKQ